MSKGHVGYIRVSTDKQAHTGYGIAAQATAIEGWSQRSGEPIIAYERDVSSGKATEGRDGLERAIALCKSGAADGIVIAKLDRLIRSVHDFYALKDAAKRDGYTLTALEFGGLDPDSPHGEMFIGMGALVSQFERRIISIRTREALAELKAQGKKLGPPRTYDEKVRRYARRCYAFGYTVDETHQRMIARYGQAPSRATVARMMRDPEIPLPNIAQEALRKVAS